MSVAITGYLDFYFRNLRRYIKALWRVDYVYLLAKNKMHFCLSPFNTMNVLEVKILSSGHMVFIQRRITLTSIQRHASTLYRLATTLRVRWFMPNESSLF